MMTLLLMYAYARGITSSREIERRCETDIAFRFPPPPMDTPVTYTRFGSTRYVFSACCNMPPLSLISQTPVVRGLWGDTTMKHSVLPDEVVKHMSLLPAIMAGIGYLRSLSISAPSLAPVPLPPCRNIKIG
ncbi:transposase [Archangium minus]|uniref:Transposase n=1 Tax=Archangium minus TaxID=83450 RepID=A0ABY9WTX5_9BACT|nr:transposase [Archangium minus]